MNFTATSSSPSFIVSILPDPGGVAIRIIYYHEPPFILLESLLAFITFLSRFVLWFHKYTHRPFRS